MPPIAGTFTEDAPIYAGQSEDAEVVGTDKKVADADFTIFHSSQYLQATLKGDEGDNIIGWVLSSQVKLH